MSETIVLCGKCQTRPGTKIWTDGVLAYVHGAYSMWCERCVLDAQIAHAEQAADQLPVLRLARAALDELPVTNAANPTGLTMIETGISKE